MKFFLKPQWCLRQATVEGSSPSITSENMHQPLGVEYAAILQKLVEGVEADSLDDAEFTLVENLNERGFLTTQLHHDSPAWELSGYNFHSVQEQLKHSKFSIVDLTSNMVGEGLRQALIDEGLSTDDNAKLVIVVADSYQQIHEYPGKNVLPVVANRMRVTIGPMIFPWGQHAGDSVRQSEHYMPEPNYGLPAAFDALQRAWINASVLQFLGGMQLRYVLNFVEYNMGKQEFKLWPLK